MHKKQLIAVAIAAVISSSAVNADAYQAQMIEVEQSRAIKDNYIVVFNTPSVLNLSDSLSVESFAIQQGNSLENRYNVNVKRNFGNSLNGVLVQANKEQLKALQQDPNVKYIEQDQIMSINPMVDIAGDQSGATWGLDRVDQRDLPLNSNYHYDFDGSGVTAYVVDTGVLNTHNEFGGRASSGYDFVDNDNDATDCNGHGTHVAGTIGGSTYGVAKNVNVVGVRVLGCSGSGSNSGVIAGINWVKNNAQGPSVANMSLGGGASQATDDAVNSAVAAGITFVVAAGNDNSNACNYSPARAADAITVGSTTSSDSRSSFSNYGSCLDIYAPGSSIKSAWYNSNSATNTISGTSMASPHVAGVAALYLDESPSSTPTQIESLLSSRSSSGKISDARSGSPNKLVYSLAGDGGGCGNDCPGGDTELTNNQGVTVNGGTGSETMFFIDVPAGATSLSVNLAGGSGDADIYVQQGTQPTQTQYQCRPYKNGNNESCDFSAPAAGKWYVMVRGYSSYSNATLTASFSTGGGGCTSGACLENGVPETNLSGARLSETFYTIDVPANSQLTVTTSGGSGDADLYVKAGSAPTTGSYDCRPYRNGNNETCSINVSQAGTYHVMLRGYSAYSGLQLTASY
ncbi:S8 family peptidase [Shewanella woodyi]|uniref:Peptidase S8 and S53 subtilisin kexin sedolisin n=1 Tax=Shewanella woodyi (strain ATCC 51908 / MS32) TaxID=392500 RepID=B1KFB1_SHEWM|nr:S8 family peptidase [Shewanella woodyi]ACA86652.1 peptidase S8 and S53 subtilisin kexin sedolisin [Shewanella woodyi ATCC 51908]